MTRKEYLKQKRANKKAFARFMRFNAQVIRADYVKAVQGFKKIVSRLPSVPLSDKNKARLVDSIPRQTLFDGITDIIRESGLTAMEKDSDIDIDYLAEAFETAGVEISKEEIKQVFGKQHTKLIERFQVKNAFRTFAPVKPTGISLIANRASYDLSSSIWEGIDSFTDKLIAYVQGSINQGIDPVIISREIERYLREGSEFVIGRWGKLLPGTAEYKKRLGIAGADYRTQRVVRTELYQMIRDNSIATGTLNPACTEKFNWVLSPAHIDWGCECADIAAGSPYTAQEAQAYSDSIHPNCLCTVEPELKDDEAFMQQLEDYVNEEDTAGAHEIETWAVKYGLTA